MTDSSSGRPRVLVLYGGQSPEHSVSCVTAAGVLNAIDPQRYEVLPIGITKHGQWVRPVVDPRLHVFRPGGPAPQVVPAQNSVEIVTGQSKVQGSGVELVEVRPDGSSVPMGRADVVLPLLHGPFGEDGTLQGLLEIAGVPYVGSGVLASAVGMDKHYMKVVFKASGLKVGSYLMVTQYRWQHHREEVLAQILMLKLPVFVKPARGGSSVGISRVDNWKELESSIEYAQIHDSKVIIEQGIAGREIECGVLGGGDALDIEVSNCGEIVVGGGAEPHQFYDYTAKYTDGSAAQISCPADLPDTVSREIQRQSIVAFEALGAEGLSRVDFFYTDDGEIVINEINTMPGFTPVSMYPQMWRSSGMEYTDLITKLLELALESPLGQR